MIKWVGVYKIQEKIAYSLKNKGTTFFRNIKVAGNQQNECSIATMHKQFPQVFFTSLV